MADFVIKQNDTQPALTDTLTAATTGLPFDLTGATVRFVMRSATATTPAINAAATITSAATGAVLYAFSGADTAIPGDFLAVWRVTWGDGTVQTFPTDGFMTVTVEADLAATSAAAILGLAETKAYLNIPDADRSHDAELQRFLDGITPTVVSFCGPIAVTAFDEWYDGGHPVIQTRKRPVTAVTSVTEYLGPVPYLLTQVATPDLGSLYSYTWDPTGKIVRRSSGGGMQPFAGGQSSVHILYSAGRATVPPNVRLGALELVRENYQPTQQGGRPEYGTSGAGADDTVAGGTIVNGHLVSDRVASLLQPTKRAPSIA